MINLAIRDIRHGWWRYGLTGLILGFLIAATIMMFGVYRGMLADALALPQKTGADIWVVQENTAGPYAEASSLYADEKNGLAGFPGVAEVANVLYFSLQVHDDTKEIRVLIAGYEDGKMGQPPVIVAGRPIQQEHYEAVADVSSGFRLGDAIQIRRNSYTVVGLTERMTSTSGDPVIFLLLSDAQDVQYKADNTSIYNDRKRGNSTEQNHFAERRCNAVLIKTLPGCDAEQVAAEIQRWKHFSAYTYPQMKTILLSKTVDLAAKQIAFFLVILELVGAAIVALLIYTMTMGKMKEIAVLKLIGANDSTITMMILQEAWGIGVIGYVIGLLVAEALGPFFPRYVAYSADIRIITMLITFFMCTLSSFVSIRAALRVEPASAIGG